MAVFINILKNGQVKYDEINFSRVTSSELIGGSRGGTGDPDSPPPEKSQNKGFLNNTGPDPLKSHIATKPALNVEPSSARQRNAIQIKWPFAGGPMMVHL